MIKMFVRQVGKRFTEQFLFNMNAVR